MRIFPITTLIEKLEEYLKVKGEQLKLELMGHTAKVLSYAVTFSLVALIALFLFFFIYLTLAVYLNSVLNSEFYGYLIVSGIILLKLLILVLLLKSGRIQKWIESIIVKIGEDEETQ